MRRKGHLATIAALALALALAGAAPAAADVGFSGPSFSGTTAPTGEKPQSKLWFHDGSWWASIFNTITTDYEIYRLDNGQWRSTGTLIDERSSSGADVLSDGSKLYVVTAGNNPETATHAPRVLRFTYDSANRRYTRDAGFPITVGSGGMASVVIDRDTTGKLWITYTRDSTVWVAHSTTSDTSWTAPFALPAANATNVGPDELSSVVAYAGKVGVFWSNETLETMYFAYHQDGASDQSWTTTIAARDPEIADNHLNVKALENDPAGQVFAATKTSLNASNDPLVLLLVLGNDGQWRRYPVFTVAQSPTRPIVLLDKANRRVYVLAASPCCSGGAIYYKESSLDNISFEPGLGTAFISSTTDTRINNPTSTKQPLTLASGLVALAGDDTAKRYWWNDLDLGAPPPDTTPPETFIDSGPSGTVSATTAEFAFSSNEPGVAYECALDGGGWTGCSSPITYSGLAVGEHTFQVRATDGAGNTDATPATRAWEVSPVLRTVFADGFESGNFGAWTTVTTGGDGTAVVQSDTVSGGTRAARLAASSQAGSRAFARKTLASAETELRVSGSFNVEAEGAKRGNVPIFRLFDSAGVRILTLYRANQSRNRIWVAHSGKNFSTKGVLRLNEWATFEVRAVAAGASSTLSVFQHGQRIYESTAADLGTAGIRSIQIGNDTSAQQFRLVADDIVATAP